MKHNYYCTVASLRHDKIFNRVSRLTTTYYECLCAALVIQHAKHMYRVILPPVACPAPHCATLYQKTARFSEKCNWT